MERVRKEDVITIQDKMTLYNEVEVVEGIKRSDHQEAIVDQRITISQVNYKQNSLVLPHIGLVFDIKAVSYDVWDEMEIVDLYKAKVIKVHTKVLKCQPDATPDLLFSPPHINVIGPLMSSKFYQVWRLDMPIDNTELRHWLIKEYDGPEIFKRILVEINEQMLTIVKGLEFDAEVAEIRVSIINKANEQGETGLFTHAKRRCIEVVKQLLTYTTKGIC
ncbi:hypothetical protein Tco_0502255 [Tanacetum coccineum]